MAHEVVASNGPFLMDLAGAALDGGVTQLFEVNVPEGTYDDLRFVVHPLEDGQRIGDPDLDRLVRRSAATPPGKKKPRQLSLLAGHRW
jgi:hypothetical protein